MRMKSVLCAASLAMCFAHLALADISVTNLSPAWLLVGNSATWVLPVSALVFGTPPCEEVCEPSGLFQFNQTFVGAPGFFTIAASNEDTGAYFTDDTISFYNSGGAGYVQFDSVFAPQAQTGTNYGVLCRGPFAQEVDACAGSGTLTTSGGAQITFTAESGTDIFDSDVPGGVDDGIRFQGATATPEPSFLLVVTASMALLVLARVWSRRRRLSACDPRSDG